MYIFIHYKKILKMSISNRKLSKKQLEVDLVFCPDVSGCSVWIDRDIIAKNETLNWGNNGNGERKRQRKLSETCWVRWTDVGVVRLDG